MKFSIILALACASLAACTPQVAPVGSGSTPPPGSAPPGSPPYQLPMSVEDSVAPAVSESALLTDKAIYAAEAIYNVPAFAYAELYTKGKLTPELKALAKPKLTAAYAALKTARLAYCFVGSPKECVRNPETFVKAVADIAVYANQASAVLPKPAVK